jgi:DNA-binding NarL/FixJ family response regulator
MTTSRTWLRSTGSALVDPATAPVGDGRSPVAVIRLLLAVDQRSFAEALAMRLDAEPGLQVVAAVLQPEQAVHAVQAHPVDVAVLAVDGEGFLTVAPQLLDVRPELKLVGVTGVDDPGLLARAVRQGFRGWVPKDVGIDVLLDVLAAVHRDETCIPPLLLTRLLQHLLHAPDEKRATELTVAGLTAREHQVLRAMTNGATRQEIAAQLSISPNTVRTHMQSILTKLGVHTSLAAVNLARRAGIR